MAFLTFLLSVTAALLSLAAQSVRGEITAPESPTSAHQANAPSGSDLPPAQVEAEALKREAVAVAHAVATAFPTNALSYALLGSAHYNTGRAEEAVRHLRRCLDLDPRLGDPYEILARVAYEKGELEDSVAICRTALSNAPPTAEILNRLGRTLLDMGRTDEAIATLRKATERPQPASESHYLLGQAYLQAGLPRDALAPFGRVIAQVTDHTQAYFGLMTAHQRLGQDADAAQARAQFLKYEALDRRALADRNSQSEGLSGLPLVRRTVAQTLFGAAQIHRAHRQPHQALALFRRAAVLDADQATYRAAIEAHFIQANALTNGVEFFKELAREQPSNPFNQLFLGRLHARLRQFSEAEEAFGKVRQGAPEWAEGYRAQAEMNLRADREPATSLALARRAVALEPSAVHHHLLAVACMKNDDHPGAVTAIKRAIALEPGDARYQKFLQQFEGKP